ncbi:hypothetical protein FRC01_012416 [Tulasnella sp. 417]|nr:hypothetical protein FRC01_012416 [Tulasnella sp. 417]
MLAPLLTVQPALTLQTNVGYFNDYSTLTPASANEAGSSHARFSPADVFNPNPFSSSSSSRHHYNYGTSSSSTTRLSVPVPQPGSYAAASYGEFAGSSSAIPPSTSTNHASLSTAAHRLPSGSSLSNFANIGGTGGVGASGPSSPNSGLPTSNYDLYSVEHSSPLATSGNQSYLEQSGRVSQDYSSSAGAMHGSLRGDSLYDLKNTSYTLPGVEDILAASGGAGPARNLRTSRTTAPYSVPSISSRSRAALSPSRYEDSPLSLTNAYDSGRDNVQTSPRRSARATPSRKTGAGSGVPLEKNFACKTCGLKFARNHDLTRHHKVHDPIKHYRCKGCDRSFTRRDALKRHNTQKNCGNEEEPQPPTTGRGRRRAATLSNVPAAEDYEGPPPLTRAPIASVQTAIPVPEAYYNSDSAVGRSNSGYIATGMESIARANKVDDTERYHLRPARQHHHPRSAHAYAPYGNASQQS